MLSLGLQTRLLQKGGSLAPVGEPAVEARAGVVAKASLLLAAAAEALAESGAARHDAPRRRSRSRRAPQPSNEGRGRDLAQGHLARVYARVHSIQLIVHGIWYITQGMKCTVCGA